MTNKATPTETVGGKYERVWFQVVSRLQGTKTWYGATKIKSEDEARREFAKQCKGSGRYMNVGGIGVDFGPDDGTVYERKMVKVVAQFEVLDLGKGPA